MAAQKHQGNMTPGRRGHRGTNNQYFEPGKVGRKTGLTLKDTGVRDEHGMEPMAGLFSSSPIASIEQEDTRLSSTRMDVAESSAPDVATTLGLRKTPRLPLARQTPPRHTNIGSPKRMSTARRSAAALSLPPDFDDDDDESPSQARAEHANRLLDFTGKSSKARQDVSAVEETNSPFKPKKNLRRSNGPIRPDPFDLQPSPEQHARHSRIQAAAEDEEAEENHVLSDVGQEWDEPMAPVDDYETPPVIEEGHTSIVEASEAGASLPATGRKRNRASFQSTGAPDDVDESIHGANQMSEPKRKRGRPSKVKATEPVDHDTETIDPSLIAHGDSYLVDVGEAAGDAGGNTVIDEQSEQQPPVKRKRGRPPKSAQAKASGTKPPSTARPQASPVRVIQRGASVGPISNVNLRATTPFEDAGQQASRYGRNLIKPLKFWENEARIYRNGDIEGIVRAQPVELVRDRAKSGRRRGRKAKSQKHGQEADSDTESVLPDNWEDEEGVLTFAVANYNPETGFGDPEDPTEQDIAFAESSIVTRDVKNANFRYAKIMTIPFFGAGLVELPPGGFKHSKNSRKMQMAFFVHDGKVAVDVGGGEGMEINQFSLSKGGVWIVPRGNNYSIENLSRTKTAKIFFAQGCEVDAQVRE